MQLTVEERVFIWESYLKTMSYTHYRQSFFEKCRRQAPVKSAIVIHTETALHPQKIGMWCAISRCRIIGPLFFETTINAEAYQELIQHFIAMLQVDERNCWFQQDSATAHTAVATTGILHEFFGKNVISKGVWSPRSPDLTSPDFFLSSSLKDTVYRSKPQDLKQLKMNITRAIEEVNERTLRKVARNAVKRVNKCIEMNGHNFQHLL
jgi:hypothetical protein